MGSSYCTRSDVLAILSQDAESRLTTDPGDAVYVGTGDGWTKTFATPFTRSTTITTYVGGVLTASTITPGATALGVVDSVTFATAPACDAIVTAKADYAAINTAIVDAAIANAADEMDAYLSRYGTPVPASLVRIMRPKAIFLVKWRLRRRRDQQEWEPMMQEYKQTYAYLMAVARGEIALPVGAAEATQVADTAAYGGETAVFDPPYSSGRTYR